MGAPSSFYGVETHTLGEIIPRQVVIVIPAEIKTDTQGLITAFGQACAYGAFSHKIYIAVPKSSDAEDKEKLESLCLIFGIGLILFDSTNPQDPRFKMSEFRPAKHEPEMFYVNKYIKLVHRPAIPMINSSRFLALGRLRA